MSIIGPRPGLWNQDVLTAERDKYGANDVKPGLTGWAQINGRDELEIPEKAKLDGYYVQNMGFKMDGKNRTRNIQINEIYEYDLNNTETELDEYCTKADFVFNLAGVNRPENPEDFMKGNFGFGKYFGSRDMGLFLDLAVYSIIAENNAVQYYPDYTYNHPLFTEKMKQYSDSTVSDFLNSVTDDQSTGFLNTCLPL